MEFIIHILLVMMVYLAVTVQAMPSQIRYLYFPIVFKNNMLIYKAVRENNIVKIVQEDIEII
jgi:hypothetical protein